MAQVVPVVSDDSDEDVSPKAMTSSVPKLALDEQLGAEGTPLHWAVYNGNRDQVDLLLKEKAEIEARCCDGCTPLHWAAQGGNRDIVDLLLEKKAQIETVHVGWAATYGHEDVVTLMLEKGADIRAKMGNGETILKTIIDGNLGLEAFVARLLTDQNLWSLSLLLDIIALNTQDKIVSILERWPRDAVVVKGIGFHTLLKRASVRERLRTLLQGPWEGKPGHLGEGDASNIDAQNLFWAQAVPITLKYLPGVCGSDATEEDFLKTLADSPHDGIFETDAVQAMVLAAWQQYRAFTLLEIVSCFLTVICLCWASYGFRYGLVLSTESLYVVAALHLKKSLDESAQAIWYFVQWLKCSANQGSYLTFDNAADALYLVGGWLAIDRQLFIGSDELEKPWMAVFAAFAWLRLLYSLRAETWMGPRLLPILSAVKDTFAFFLVLVVCLASGAHAYYNLQIRDEPTPTYAAFMQVVRLGIFGDFDLFEFEGLDPTYRLKNDGNEWEPVDPSPGPDYVYVHVLFYMTGVGIAVLLMNVLIGVLSSNYERYEDQSIGQFLRARVKMIVELQRRPLTQIFRYMFKVRGGWLLFCLHESLRILYMFCLPVIVILYMVCLLFFRGNGMLYTFSSSVGHFNKHGDGWSTASECCIFFAVRDEPDVNEVRSVRTELKRRLEGIQKQQRILNSKLKNHLETKIEKLDGKLDNMEKHHQVLESKISQIHDTLIGQSQMGRRNCTEEHEGLDSLLETLEAASPRQAEMERPVPR